MATLTLPVKSISSKQALDKTIIETSVEDFYFVLRGVFAQEVQGQIQIGNPPSNILVDGKVGVSIYEARKRLQAFFVDTKEVAAAANDVWKTLVSLTRIRTGKARHSFMFFLNYRQMGSIEEAVSKMSINDFVGVVGPTTKYGRVLWWNPLVVKYKKKTIVKGDDVKIKELSLQSTGSIALSRLKSRHRGVNMFIYWPKTPELGDTPGIAIGWKKGKVPIVRM